MQRTEELFVFMNTNSLCGTHMQIDPNMRLYNSSSKPLGRNPPPKVPQGYAKSPDIFLKFTTSLNPPVSTFLHLLLLLFFVLVII